MTREDAIETALRNLLKRAEDPPINADGWYECDEIVAARDALGLALGPFVPDHPIESERQRTCAS